MVTLTANAGSGASFQQWGGACSGTTTTCTLPMTAARFVTATFAQAFTDSPLTAGSTTVRATHVTELRTAINTLRTQVFGLPAFNFTDPTLTAGSTVIQALHISELRAALADAYAAAGQSAPSYTDSTLTAMGTPIRASHILEVRAAVQALE